MKAIQAILTIAAIAIALLSNPAVARPPSSGSFTNVDIDVYNLQNVVTLSFQSSQTCTPKVSLYRKNGGRGVSIPYQTQTGVSGTSHSFVFPLTDDDHGDFYFKIEGVEGNSMYTKITEVFHIGFGT